MTRDFIANTTHELRTPLSIIKSYAEAIYDDILNKDQIKEYAYSIMIEADHLNNLINEILELSKLQSGTIQLNIQPINLKSLFNEIISEVNIIKGNRKFWLFEDDIVTKADSKLLKRAFSNIIINAVNHTNDTGNVYIKAEKENAISKYQSKMMGKVLMKQICLIFSIDFTAKVQKKE